MSFADAAAIFIVIPVNDVMAAVLDAPVLTIVLKHLRGAGQRGRFAGNPIDDVAISTSLVYNYDLFSYP